MSFCECVTQNLNYSMHSNFLFINSNKLNTRIDKRSTNIVGEYLF